MTCNDDTLMKPQIEEGIVDLRWMSAQELDLAVANSYASIKFVIEAYKEAIAQPTATLKS
jgi:hypothetical protein